ncbi:hypothetical protein, partial [Escherichia coli]|uniref:hypothetical protein n=1 Tax=Escherichia coli TaxID=562 RepID=UPI001BDB94B9
PKTKLNKKRARKPADRTDTKAASATGATAQVRNHSATNSYEHSEAKETSIIAQHNEPDRLKVVGKLMEES